MQSNRSRQLELCFVSYSSSGIDSTINRSLLSDKRVEECDIQVNLSTAEDNESDIVAMPSYCHNNEEFHHSKSSQ